MYVPILVLWLPVINKNTTQALLYIHSPYRMPAPSREREVGCYANMNLNSLYN